MTPGCSTDKLKPPRLSIWHVIGISWPADEGTNRSVRNKVGSGGGGMPDSYVRWLEFQHTPLPKLYNNPGSIQVRSKRDARSGSATCLEYLLQMYELKTYVASGNQRINSINTQSLATWETCLRGYNNSWAIDCMGMSVV